MTKPLVEVKDLTKTFRIRGKKATKTAVDHVSFAIPKGTAFGLIGESGSGKSTVGRLILHLLEADSGQILFDGNDITHADMRPYRHRIQVIFQNTLSSLDPKYRIYDVIAEGLRANHLTSSKAEEQERVFSLLNQVGLNEQDARKYPYEFSGGQQQRIVIARALAVEPELLICDEPVSALDVSYQAQILNLLEELQEKRNMTYLFISHDLSVINGFCDQIGVMYQGKLVETGSTEQIICRPQHPYTQSLMSAIPIPDPVLAKKKEHVSIDFPQMVVTSGCTYAPRCPFANNQCYTKVPEFHECESGHFHSCMQH